MEMETWYSFDEFLEVFDDFSKERQIAERDYYHQAVYFPEWKNESEREFIAQVADMASSTKPFKATDTFKIQGGYPHEVERQNQLRLSKLGIRPDINFKKRGERTPKLKLESFTLLMNNNKVVSYCTPKDTQFIREVVLVDDETHENLIIFYVVSRKARVLSTWSAKKENGKTFTPRLDEKNKWKYRQP
tara:strand:+ start:1233 stop:1799 length:567 start_codon:yes stop_codon:yes gene_type:complete